MKEKYNTCMQLFTTFFRIGAFTFGGGYAMIPIIQKEAVEKRHWIKDEDIIDLLAIAESTPGVLAVNSATFVGYNVGGFWGSLAATVGVVLPSFIIILILSGFYLAFRQNVWVDYAFRGIKAGVCVLLLKSFMKLYKALDKKAFHMVLLALAIIASAVIDIESIFIILSGGIIGYIYCTFFRDKKEAEK
ncbi:MAG: chromate transporter [Eubacteriaceae bacterium]|nr:chromate transporter [Eubacteriaceae bacterium]